MAQIQITAQNALKELNNLANEFNTFKNNSKNLGGNAAESLSNLDKRITSTRALVETLGHRLNFLTAQLKQAQTQTSNNKSSFQSLTNSLDRNTKATDKNTKSSNKSTSSYKRQEKQVIRNKKANVSLGKSLKTLISSFGIIGGLVVFKNIASEAFSLIKTFDSLRFSMNIITKTSFDLADSQVFLADITERYGLNIVSTTNRYTKFLAAAQQSNLSIQNTQKIFSSASKAASVLGLSTSDLEGVFLALEQIISKGRVSTEELRRQLGERLPGAFGIMAAALDVTVPKLDEMLRKGEVLSSEALPKFAEALEVAYGIEAVDKVETLTSAQNRLTNSWQNFIKIVSSGALNKALQVALDFLADFFNAYSEFFANSEQRIQALTVKGVRRARREFEEESKAILDSQKKQGKRSIDIERAIQDQRIKVAAQIDQKDLNREQAKLDTLISQQVNYNKELEKISAKRAADELKRAEKTLRSLKVDLDEDIKERDKLQDIRGRNADSPTEAGFNIKRLDRLNNTIKVNEFLIGDVTGRIIVLRQAIDAIVPINSAITGKDDGKLKIDTSDLDLLLARLKIQAEALKQISKDEQRELGVRLSANKQYYEILGQIESVQGRKRVRLAKGNLNKLRQIEEEVSFQLLQIQEQSSDEATKIAVKSIENGVKKIANAQAKSANERIANIKREYALLGELSAEQETKLANEIADIKRDAANTSNQEQADFIRNQLDALGIFGEERVKLEQLIQKLLASIELEGNNDRKKNQENYIDDIIDLTHRFAESVADVYNSLLDARIANIDAEIEAERRKFDELIRLAEGDEEQQAALEQQREIREQKLRARKLAAERKQAKLQKAIALADIGVKLAQTIVAHNLAGAEIDAVTLGVGGQFYRSINIPLSIALAAAQAAAVLAAPIPQFKHGVKDLPNDTVAMINDGGKQEFVERDGQILTTRTKNAIVDLKKNDTVWRDYNDMVKNSKLVDSFGTRATSINLVNEKQDLEAAVIRGFKKAKISNNINIVNKSSNNSYKQQLKKWN